MMPDVLPGETGSRKNAKGESRFALRPSDGQACNWHWKHREEAPHTVRQRIAAVRKLEAMGYVFHEHDWTGPAIPAAFEADAMHALLVLRADAIED